jgi:hypothetical protein
MAKRIDKLTDEQQSRFQAWSNRWIEIGLSTAPADFDAATEAALKAYKLCNLAKPTVILRMGSPYAATVGGAYAWLLLKEVFKQQVGQQVGQQVEQQVGQQVRQQVGQQVGQQVWQQVWQQVEQQVRQQVRQQVEQQVWQQVWQQVGQQVEQQVGQQVEQQVWQQVEQQVWQQVEQQVWQQVWQQVEQQSFKAAVDGFCNYGINSLWSSWGAYVSFFRDVCGWEDPVLEKFEIDEALVKSCGWTWWHQNVLAISDRPSEIHRDVNGRLHGEKGPSISYRDGWSLYHWHGVSIPAEWVTGKAPTAQEALTWANIEQRRAACEIVGWNNILQQLDAKVINADEDEEIGTLLEVNLPDSGKERFLQVRCGTGRSFALPVPKEMRTAMQANAWSYGIDDLKLFKPEVRT